MAYGRPNIGALADTIDVDVVVMTGSVVVWGSINAHGVLATCIETVEARHGSTTRVGTLNRDKSGMVGRVIH